MKRYLIAVFIVLIPFFNMVTFGYGVWDKTSAVVSPVIQIGAFTLPVSLEDLNEEITDAFFDFFGVDNLTDLYANQTFQEIMNAASCTGTGCSAPNTYIVNDIQIENYKWEVQGVFTVQSGRRSIGFMRQIDRSLNGSTPVFPVLPDPTTDPSVDYFTAYDVLNTETNNNASIRLDNQIQLTTEEPIANFSKISFYALRGLRINNNENLANRVLTVSISADGTNFTQIGSFTTQAPIADIFSGSAVSQTFEFYEYELTQAQINNMPPEGYYIRIIFNGGAQNGGNNVSRSRVIIDDLTIHLLDD